MGDENTWRRVLNIIEGYDKPVVVVSATARTTRKLVSAAEMAQTNLKEALTIAESIKERHLLLIEKFIHENKFQNSNDTLQKCNQWIENRINHLKELLRDINSVAELHPWRSDAVASIGEQLSARLFALCGQAFGLPMQWVDAKDIIATNSSFGQALPNQSAIQANSSVISDAVHSNTIPVMGGFYGQNDQGQITTLGFEGSDYSASLIGAALEAEAVEIWTDVSGIYTCDPRVVESARPIAELSFQEATELAYFGAKVLHPSTMNPASDKNIPVYVKNIFEPDQPGTKIHNQTKQNGSAKALTYLKDSVILTVTADHSMEGHHFLAEVFRLLDEAKQPVNAVTTTEASISVALQQNDHLQELERSLKKAGDVERHSEQGLISLIGCAFDDIQTIQKRVFNGIADIQPSLMSYSKSKRNLNIAVSETSLIPAVCRIHDLLFDT